MPVTVASVAGRATWCTPSWATSSKATAEEIKAESERQAKKSIYEQELDKNDDIEDQITPNGWIGDGGSYRIDLIGTAYQPPEWAMPVMVIGGTMTALVLLRFIWDQVI